MLVHEDDKPPMGQVKKGLTPALQCFKTLSTQCRFVEVKKKLVQHEQEALELARMQHQKEVWLRLLSVAACTRQRIQILEIASRKAFYFRALHKPSMGLRFTSATTMRETL